MCHDHDWTHPHSPYPDLPSSFPSHQNHSRAPLAKPEPSGSILSQLISKCIPEPSDPLVSQQHIPDTIPIPDPTQCYLTFPLSCIKSTPNVSSVSQLWLGKAWLCTSLAWCVLVCPFPPSIYLYVSLCLVICYPSSVPPPHPQFPISVNPCFIYLYSLPPLTLL